ncbi:hypothetical protein L195_g062616, partial [Trifolium pratense]
MRLSLPLSQQH